MEFFAYIHFKLYGPRSMDGMVKFYESVYLRDASINDPVIHTITTL